VRDVEQFVNDVLRGKAARMINDGRRFRQHHPHQRTTGTPILPRHLKRTDPFQANGNLQTQAASPVFQTVLRP